MSQGNNLENKKIAVICGGWSSERAVSIKSGTNVFLALKNKNTDCICIEIREDKIWQIVEVDENCDIDQESAILIDVLNTKGGIKNGVSELKAIYNIDLVFNAMHGEFGEDGGLQAILDVIGIKYTGSGVGASNMAMNKILTYNIAEKYGINVPKTLSINKNYDIDIVKEALSEFEMPLFVKTNDGGSSIGISKINDIDELEKAIEKVLNYSDIALIQEYLQGKEFTCPVIGNNEKARSMYVGELILDSELFDYDAKYNSSTTQEIFPANISAEFTQKIQGDALLIHQILGCNGLSRSDFIIDDKRNKVYFLEINTSPGMTSASWCPKGAKAEGVNYEDFVIQICQTAL